MLISKQLNLFPIFAFIPVQYIINLTKSIMSQAVIELTSQA